MSNLDVFSKNRTLVVFGEDWGKHPSSTQHLVKELSNNRKIVWINSIGLRKPDFSWRDIIRVFRKLTTFLGTHKKSCLQQDEIPSNFVVINPLVMPCANSWLSIKLSQWMLSHQLNKLSIKINIENPIVWCSLPTAVDYLSIFEDSTSVYYCGDDFGSLAGVDHDVVLQKETLLTRRVKYIFTASEALLSKFPKEKAVTLPHGVNFSLFNRKYNERPVDLPSGHSIVGFYGSISSWLDQALILYAAQTLPSWNFVFIGNVECNIDKLLNVPNIYFIGPKSHCELPKYIQHWNVALLPFKDNKQIQMCNPLKLREYIASGTPIVSTNFNALEEYKQHVMVVKDKRDICRALLLADAEISESTNFNNINDINDLLALSSAKKKRARSVINESWQQRASQVERYLLQC
jgi:glycosyltransferase involved in cell wall biosynthesis